MESRERAGGSLKDLFEFSDEINYTYFLTDEALSPLYPPSSVTSGPGGDDSSVLIDTHIFDFPTTASWTTLSISETEKVWRDLMMISSYYK